MAFAHLHVHTQYSVLDGANKIKPLLERVAELGQESVAITDHGNMHGAVEFFSAAKEAGVKPIIGCEIYLTNGSRHDRTASAQGGPSTHHLTLLVQNSEGYKNLCRLVTLAYTEGFYRKPRIDWELLGELNSGLICLSGCMSSEFGSQARYGRGDISEELAVKYHKAFGDRFYLEVQPHPIEEQKNLNDVAAHVGSKLGIPLVATNDCHYLLKEDHYAQEVLMCIGTGKQLSDEGRIRHDDLTLHLKSEEEMLEELPSFHEAVSTTAEIAERCSLDFDFSTYHMPKFEPARDDELDSIFKRDAEIGLEKRFAELCKLGKDFDKEGYKSRLCEEIEIICRMGFPGYFLVVSDFIVWAKENDVPVGPGRGSAAGSLVAWAMFITEIDPIANKLLFERFLNPERVSLPDIDVDFCIHGRDKVIDYVTKKYGKDKVAQIVTFGTLKAKAAIKDVGRAMGVSYSETDRVAKLVPAPRQGFDYPLAEALKMEKRLQEYADGEGKELIELALKLEGLSRHTSTHAAGLVISDRPIDQYMPLMVDKDGQIISQYSMNWVEKIGLVKFDFLGLKTLTVIHEAVRLLKRHGGVELSLNSLPQEDAKTYKYLSQGRTAGVFQLESSGITEMVKRLKPSCFEDIVAILALYRPGPLDSGMAEHYINRKHGREKVSYLHEVLEPILEDTYGIILYQEQIMRIAQDMAGYSLGEADMLRRAMGKKKPEEMAKQREIFIRGALNNNIPNAVAVEVFNQMETFARYGFNRSHSVAYALISFQTAYLKAHYPVYFMAALMSNEMGDADKTLKNLNECGEMKIKVMPPDVNCGEAGFSVEKNKIRFGLAALKGVGEKAVLAVVNERNKLGDYKGLLDFCIRLESSLLNRRLLESLINSGGFDWTGFSRAELNERLELVIKRAAAHKAQKNSNQMDLFAENDVPQEVYQPNRPLLKEWAKSVKLLNEKAALGFYLSGHPLEQFKDDITSLGTKSVVALFDMRDGESASVVGIITLLKLKNTKKGERYATFVLEDMLGTIEVIVWPDIYQKSHEILSGDEPVLLSGRLDINEERGIIVAQEIVSVVERRKQGAKEVRFMLDSNSCKIEHLKELRQLLSTSSGRCKVRLYVKDKELGETVVALSSDITVEPNAELRLRVEQIFGEQVMSVL